MLLGAKQGPVVATHDLEEPKLQISCDGEVRLRISQWENLAEEARVSLVLAAQGHEIPPAAWTMIEVLSGDHKKVLCTLVSKVS
jgi:hypothetical protein